MMGWAPNQAIQDAFVAGANVFAPNVQTTFLDGMDPAARFAVWSAADIATSLVDNIQETFGLVVVEAMACGLPIVASDWDGYRDLVDHGSTGFLAPTTMVARAADTAPSRLLFGEISYDHFLAESSQTVAVDVAAAALAFTRFIEDESLRRSLGESAQRRLGTLRLAQDHRRLRIPLAVSKRPTPGNPPLAEFTRNQTRRWHSIALLASIPNSINPSHLILLSY